jgi:hypothetical protein
MNEVLDRLDGIQRWFYGGEPGMDDLPLEDELAAATPSAEELPSHGHACCAGTQALPQR